MPQAKEWLVLPAGVRAVVVVVVMLVSLSYLFTPYPLAGSPPVTVCPDPADTDIFSRVLDLLLLIVSVSRSSWNFSSVASKHLSHGSPNRRLRMFGEKKM